ncbi:MAG TPA: pyridoxamine 5'-phosphate oxidase family protein [Pyrinomonadaceae bacterium]|nr:pyridoxamine 5'-phosphate oxidase family protein [Pyrinomonadaceae bacterium]
MLTILGRAGFVSIAILIALLTVSGQDKKERQRETIIAAARELMTTTRYCALITVDGKSQAHARTMDPFPPDENLVVWLATNPRSRKVAEIRRNPRVTLYYFDAASQGYVSIYGRARVVDDPKEKARHWKNEWKDFYPDRVKSYLLIAVTPEKMEIVIVKKDIVGNSTRWTPPSVTFKRNKRLY